MIDIKLPHGGHIASRTTVVSLPGMVEATRGETVLLGVEGAGPLGRWVILDAWSGDLAMAPAALLEAHYDPLCRSYSGLCFVLQMLGGGPDSGRPNAKVTLLVVAPEPASKIVVAPAGALKGLGPRP